MPVSAATGDNQASVYSTIADENDILFGVGTGSRISLLSNKILHENVETRPCFEGKNLLCGTA